MRWIGALLLVPLALAAQTAPDDACSISGQVSNAATGEPLRRALVYLRRVDMSPAVTNIQVSQTSFTDAAGRFVLTGIAPGKYRLSAERSGFITMQYGARGPNKAGTLLTLEAGQKSSDMAIRMTPHGVIAGHVMDEEGEPVANANVQVSRQQYVQGRKQLARTNGASTNDLGEYRVFGLSPGRYYVSVESRQNPSLPQGEDDYVPTYFPRTTDSTAAAPIDLTAGAQLRNIDITLAKMHTVMVRGRVVSEIRTPSAADNPQRTNVMLTARNTAVGGGLTRGAMLTPQGTFEFRSVTPGSYYVVGVTNIAGKALTARAPIQVGSSNIEGITLTIRNGVPVSGRVRAEEDAPVGKAQMRVALQTAEMGGVVFSPPPVQQVKEDGSFLLEEVGADRYTVSVNGLPEGYYLKSVRSGNLDVLANGLEVAGGSPAPLEVVLSSHSGQVSGTVLDPKSQKPAVSATVVLVPQEKERRDRDALYRTATTDQAGAFSFKGLVPGEYRVYAWDDVEFGAWMDPDFLKPVESKGEAVSVPESGRQSVQVNLISADSQ